MIAPEMIDAVVDGEQQERRPEHAVEAMPCGGAVDPVDRKSSRNVRRVDPRKMCRHQGAYRGGNQVWIVGSGSETKLNQ